MSEAPDGRPRTWVPLAAAGAVGVVVVAGAVVAFALGSAPDETEAAAIAACEAEYASQGGPAIVTGEIYEPTEWRDHYAFVQAEGEVSTPVAEMTDADAAAREERAERFAEEGEGTLVIVWRTEDDDHAQCAIPVRDGAVDADSAVVGPLAVAPPDLDQ